MKTLQRILLCVCALCALSFSFATDNATTQSPVYVAKSTGTVPVIEMPQTQASDPTLKQAIASAAAQTLVDQINQFVNILVSYEPANLGANKSGSIGVLARIQVAKISKLGCDIDALTGMAAPTNKLSLGGKSFSDFSGQAGIGISWSWTKPRTPYYARVGFGVLETAGSEPQGTVYGLIGIR
jgi:hypothetical protein